MFVCLGRNEDNTQWWISDNFTLRLIDKDVVRHNVIDNCIQVANIKVGRNNHINFKREFVDIRFQDFKFLCYVLDTAAQVDIMPVVFDNLINLSKDNFDEYRYFKGLLDRIINLYYNYMQDITIKSTMYNCILSDSKDYLTHLGSYLQNDTLSDLVLASDFLKDNRSIYTVFGGIMLRDFVCYVYKQIYIWSFIKLNFMFMTHEIIYI